MSKVVFTVILLLPAPALAQDDFESWRKRCLDPSSLWSEEAKTFCRGFNFYMQNNPLKDVSCGWQSGQVDNIGGNTSAITTNSSAIFTDIIGGNVLDTAPDPNSLMVTPDAPATISSPFSINSIPLSETNSIAIE